MTVRAAEPTDGTERDILLGWLAFHRDALEAKCAGLAAEQLAARAVPPSALSLLGLVRHLAEMERVYAAWAVGPAAELRFIWGQYTEGGPDWDFEVGPDQAVESLAAWRGERAAADASIAGHPTLDSIGAGNGRSLRWNLQKLVGEYARHNGHADLLRECIDGRTGE